MLYSLRPSPHAPGVCPDVGQRAALCMTTTATPRWEVRGCLRATHQTNVTSLITLATMHVKRFLLPPCVCIRTMYHGTTWGAHGMVANATTHIPTAHEKNKPMHGSQCYHATHPLRMKKNETPPHLVTQPRYSLVMVANATTQKQTTV